MQPESHLFPVTLNKMPATPVGPMWGPNQMGCVLRSFYPTARENELYLWGETWGHVTKCPPPPTTPPSLLEFPHKSTFLS